MSNLDPVIDDGMIVPCRAGDRKENDVKDTETAEARAREVAERLVDGFKVGGKFDPTLYTATAVGWHNTDELEIQPMPLDPIRTVLPDFALHDERIDAWSDGFVVRGAFQATAKDGSAIRIVTCIVATLVDGRIDRLEEYVDSAQAATLATAFQ